MKVSGLSRDLRCIAVAAALVAALSLPGAPARAAEFMNDAAWNPGSSWLSLRFGYAKEQGRYSPNGNVGYGMGYSRMISKRLSLGANVQHDLLGKFNGSALIALPVTAEVLWHFHWKTPFRPYVGAGLQSVYRKLYRTGADLSEMQPGYCVSLGGNSPIDPSHLLGIDLRFASVSNDQWSHDPVFLVRRPSNLLISAKLNYSLTY